MMSYDSSITDWFHELKEGDGAAARKLWSAYFTRMRDVARRHVRPMTGYDEEDVALSAFFVFCQSLKAGQLPQVQNRDELWNLLLRMTVLKATDRFRHEGAIKRGGGRRNPAAIRLSDAEFPLEQLAAQIPDPDFEVMMAEECRRLLDKLRDAELERVAILKLDGFTNQEIANQMNYSRRTIQRMINVVRHSWEAEWSGSCTG